MVKTTETKGITEWKITKVVKAPLLPATRTMMNLVLTPCWLPFFMRLDVIERFRHDPAWLALRAQNAPSSDGRKYVVDQSVWIEYSNDQSPVAAFFDSAPMNDYPLDQFQTRFYGHQMLRYLVPVTSNTTSVTLVGYWDHTKYGFTGDAVLEQVAGVLNMVSAGLQKYALITEYLYQVCSDPRWLNSPDPSSTPSFDNLSFVPLDLLTALHSHPQFGPIPGHTPTMEALMQEPSLSTRQSGPTTVPVPSVTPSKERSTLRTSHPTWNSIPSSSSSSSKNGGSGPERRSSIYLSQNGITTSSRRQSGTGVSSSTGSSSERLPCKDSSGQYVIPSFRSRVMSRTHPTQTGATNPPFPLNSNTSLSGSPPSAHDVAMSVSNRTQPALMTAPEFSSGQPQPPYLQHLLDNARSWEFDESSRGILVLAMSPQLEIIYANSAACMNLATSPSWILGTPISALQPNFHPNVHDLIHELLPPSCLGSGSGPTINIQEGVSRFSHTSGYTLWNLVRARLVPVGAMSTLASGQPQLRSSIIDHQMIPTSIAPAFLELGAFVIILELSDMSQVLDTLDSSVDRLSQQSPESVPVPMISALGFHGMIQSTNHVLRKELGWQDSQLVGHPWWGILALPDAEVQAYLAELETFRLGRNRCFVSWCPVYTAKGTLRKALVSVYKTGSTSHVILITTLQRCASLVGL